METRDGFIIGVYNYCDRWCERCPLAIRCHVYVDGQLERQGIESAPPNRESDALAWDRADGERRHFLRLAVPDTSQPSLLQPELSPDAAVLDRRAHSLGRALLDARVPAGPPADRNVAAALQVIGHFGYFLGPKVHRALIGLEEWDDPDARRDATGSAKAALLALDELEAAWLRLTEARLVDLPEAEPVLCEMSRVKDALEDRFPEARAFVRPGLDEPEAVAMLEWQERG